MENQSTWCFSSESFNGMASWFGSSVASAFFASLDRWSCINVSTSDDDDNEDETDTSTILSNSASLNHAPAHQNDVANLPV